MNECRNTVSLSAGIVVLNIPLDLIVLQKGYWTHSYAMYSAVASLFSELITLSALFRRIICVPIFLVFPVSNLYLLFAEIPGKNNTQ